MFYLMSDIKSIRDVDGFHCVLDMFRSRVGNFFDPRAVLKLFSVLRATPYKQTGRTLPTPGLDLLRTTQQQKPKRQKKTLILIITVIVKQLSLQQRHLRVDERENGFLRKIESLRIFFHPEMKVPRTPDPSGQTPVRL